MKNCSVLGFIVLVFLAGIAGATDTESCTLPYFENWGGDLSAYGSFETMESSPLIADKIAEKLRDLKIPSAKEADTESDFVLYYETTSIPQDDLKDLDSEKFYSFVFPDIDKNGKPKNNADKNKKYLASQHSGLTLKEAIRIISCYNCDKRNIESIYRLIDSYMIYGVFAGWEKTSAVSKAETTDLWFIFGDGSTLHLSSKFIE